MVDNIFMALQMEQNEVVMCRFLADLLDPDGRHGSGARFLKSFLEEFLPEIDVEAARLESTCVMTEYLIDNGRRIDIMVQNPAFSVPIEVKINARDQEGQCHDYYPYARNVRMVYLTKGGVLPSDWSRAAKDGSRISKDQIRCISWGDICDWLGKFDVPEQVGQYIEAIQSFLSKPAARADCDLVRRLLREFQDEMGKEAAERYGLRVLEDSFCSYHENVWKREKQSLTFCPGLNYQVESADSLLPDDLRMWFRIEVADDGYLSAGFCLVSRKEGEYGTKKKVDDSAIKVVKGLGNLRYILSRDNWWFVWRFSNGKQDVSRDAVPNFRTMNECAVKLAEREYREEFVKKTIRIFEDRLLGYLKH